MSDRFGTVFGFLGGTIVAVDSGYKVFPHPKSEKVYKRLSDAKWFLALRWCDSFETPAGIINNVGELSFINKVVLEMGEEKFIPQQYRLAIFEQCLPLQPNEAVIYSLPDLNEMKDTFRQRKIEIQSLSIDSRYGKVALVRETF